MEYYWFNDKTCKGIIRVEGRHRYGFTEEDVALYGVVLGMSVPEEKPMFKEAIIDCNSIIGEADQGDWALVNRTTIDKELMKSFINEVINGILLD